MRSMWTKLMRGRLQPVRRVGKSRSFAPQLEQLGDRVVPAVTATFTAGTNTLTVTGDGADNAITVSRDAAGAILVNGGAVAVAGGTPTIANTALIQVSGLGGNDTITLDEANGALPAANLSGGDGNDTITGGSGNDTINGDAGNDILFGKGGTDILRGGADDDTLTGGDADDQVFGDAGDDRMIWNPGDDTDLNEGGDGNDTVEVNGGNGAETFTVTANGTRVRFDRVTPAPFSIDIGTSEGLVVSMNGGDDSFSATGNLAALIQITVDGGTGNDTILGSNGADLLLGGDGNDFIDGNQGDDTALLGAGDDVFQWDPGDGSDIIEGQAGADLMLFNGANINEIIDISANGPRVRFTRNIGNIVMDLDDVEGIDFNALGGLDNITVNDLTGTDVTKVRLNLGTDGSADTITVFGTNGPDAVAVSGIGPNAEVTGLTARVVITGAEPIQDVLQVKTLDGDDVIDASHLVGPAIQFVADGGTGNNTIVPPGGTVAAPVAKADALSVTEDSKANALNVLANDLFVPGPGIALTITAVGKPANGTATIAPDGKSIVYTPRVNFVGTDTFSYTITDGRGSFATATVTVNVQDRPDGRFAIGFGAGGPAFALLLDANTGAPKVIVDAFPGFFGGVSVAAGDVNGDGTPDLIAAAGPGGGGLIKVFDGTNGSLVTSFFAFPGFQGGLNVAAGDINRDGFADIIVGTASGIGAVGVFNGRNGALLNAFLPFGGLPIGVNVGSGDVNNDGRDDIVVGTASNIAAVGVFSGRDFSALNVFLPFGGFPTGVSVAAGDVNGDGFADLILGTTSGIGLVQEVSGRDMKPLASFLPNGLAPVGMRVASEDMNGDGRADIVAGTASGPGIVTAFDGRDARALGFRLSLGAFGGVFVG